MERRLTEEKITKSIISWLEKNGWEIVCFDFPQSGTGKVLHSNNRAGLKNKDSIIPDIIAIKDGVVVFFENKDRFSLSDFQKLENIKKENNYSDSLSQLLLSYEYTSIYYGAGFPITLKNRGKVNDNKIKVDFVIDSDSAIVKVDYQIQRIFK